MAYMPTLLLNSFYIEKMAEGKGFEPPKGVSSLNDLANRRLQPLGHPSAKSGYGTYIKTPRRMQDCDYTLMFGLSNRHSSVLADFLATGRYGI